MCGTTEEQFAELMVVLAPSVEQRKRRLADRPHRKRAPGPGQKPAPWWLRLLVALTHLRQGSSVRATAAVFGIHERSVRRDRDEGGGGLGGDGVPPPRGGRPGPGP